MMLSEWSPLDDVPATPQLKKAKSSRAMLAASLNTDALSAFDKERQEERLKEAFKKTISLRALNLFCDEASVAPPKRELTKALSTTSVLRPGACQRKLKNPTKRTLKRMKNRFKQSLRSKSNRNLNNNEPVGEQQGRAPKKPRNTNKRTKKDILLMRKSKSCRELRRKEKQDDRDRVKEVRSFLQVGTKMEVLENLYGQELVAKATKVESKMQKKQMQKKRPKRDLFLLKSKSCKKVTTEDDEEDDQEPPEKQSKRKLKKKSASKRNLGQKIINPGHKIIKSTISHTKSGIQHGLSTTKSGIQHGLSTTKKVASKSRSGIQHGSSKLMRKMSRKNITKKQSSTRQLQQGDTSESHSSPDPAVEAVKVSPTSKTRTRRTSSGSSKTTLKPPSQHSRTTEAAAAPATAKKQEVQAAALDFLRKSSNLSSSSSAPNKKDAAEMTPDQPLEAFLDNNNTDDWAHFTPRPTVPKAKVAAVSNTNDDNEDAPKAGADPLSAAANRLKQSNAKRDSKVYRGDSSGRSSFARRELASSMTKKQPSKRELMLCTHESMRKIKSQY